MKSFRLRRRIAIAGLALLGLLPAQGSRHAAAAEPLLRPTPLVLKDGRIANVSIHVLPFAAGQAELAAEPAAHVEAAPGVPRLRPLVVPVVGLDAGDAQAHQPRD